MPGGGKLRIGTTWISHPPGVSVEFQDSGGGIAPEITEDLFEPFHTTKPEGLGLGLFISQNIIRQHGGFIEAQSEADEGATFTVWLPA
jgi:signal transduction histidine kinase